MGRGSRARNLRVTLESSSRTSIVFLSASIAFEYCGPGRGRSLFGSSGDKPRRSTNPRLDVDGDGDPGSGLLAEVPAVLHNPYCPRLGEFQLSRCSVFRAARLSTRRSNSDDESTRVWDERMGQNCSFRTKRTFDDLRGGSLLNALGDYRQVRVGFIEVNYRENAGG